MTTEIVNTETGEILAPIDRVEAERLTTRIRLRLDTIADNYVAVMPLIREAIDRQAWSVLGYSGVSEYVSECFGDALAQLPPNVRREVVAELAASGMSSRAIAPVVAVSDRMVRKDLAAVHSGGNQVPTSPEPTFISATDALAEINGTSQDAPETPLAENGISEPAEATDAEGPEPAPSLSQVITGEAAGEVPAADDPSGAIQPERGVDPTSPPAPSNVIGIDGKTYKRPTPSPKPQRSGEQQNAEENSRTLASSLIFLLAFQHPAQRDTARIEWEAGRSAVAPTNRDYVTPDRMRQAAEGLALLADEWENTHE